MFVSRQAVCLGGESRWMMRLTPSRAPRHNRLPRLALLTAAGVVLLLVGAFAASGRSTAQQATTIRFTVSQKGKNRLPGGRVRTTLASGRGPSPPAATPQAGTEYKSTGATGTIRFHGWRVVGSRVIDDANLSMDVVSGSYRFINRMQRVVLQTKVTKSDPNEKFKCPTGSTGGAGLLGWRGKNQPGSFSTTELCR